MTKEQLIADLSKAQETTRNWPIDGWDQAFGPRQVNVPNLKAAEDLPGTASHRQESLAYWEMVAQQSAEMVESAQKALDALKNDDLYTADIGGHFSVGVKSVIEAAITVVTNKAELVLPGRTVICAPSDKNLSV